MEGSIRSAAGGATTPSDKIRILEEILKSRLRYVLVSVRLETVFLAESHSVHLPVLHRPRSLRVPPRIQFLEQRRVRIEVGTQQLVHSVSNGHLLWG